MPGMIGSGVSVPKPASKPEEILAWFQLMVSPEGVQKALDLRKEWEDARAANEELLNNILTARNAQEMLRAAEQKQAEARAQMKEVADLAETRRQETADAVSAMLSEARGKARSLREEAESKMLAADEQARAVKREQKETDRLRQEVTDLADQARREKQRAVDAQDVANSMKAAYEERLAELNATLAKFSS